MFKKTIISVVALTLVFGLGIFVGAKISKAKTQSTNQAVDAKAIYQTAYEAAQQDLAKINADSVSQNAEASSNGITGNVQKISEDSITFTKILPENSSAQPAELYIAQVTADTKFFELVQENSQQYKTGKNISLSDIKIGQLVLVETKENVEDKKELTAVSISVMPVK